MAGEGATQDDATAGVTAAVALPPLYAAADPRAQALLQQVAAFDDEVYALRADRVLDPENRAMIMCLPTDSGILVINVRRWRASGVTRTIERLLQRFVSSNGQLWHDGVSQPPLLLALCVSRSRSLDLGVIGW